MTSDKSICRACASESTEYRALHKEGLMLGKVTTLAKLLSFCTNIEFPPGESDIPSIICESCVQKLARAYKFKQQVIKANDTLRGVEEKADSTNIEKNEMQYVVLGVVLSKDGKEEFIISREIDEDEPIISFSKEDMTEEIHVNKDNEENKSEKLNEDHLSDDMKIKVSIEDVADEFTVFTEEDAEVEIEEASEHSSDDIENSEQKDTKESYHNYVVSMMNADEADIDIDSCNEVFMSEVEATNSQSDDNQSRTQSPSQSLESDLQSDSTFIDKLKIIPKMKPVKRRNMKSKPKECNPDLQCEVCGKQLSNPNSYKYHMQLHSDNTPFLCNLCGEGFKTRNAYDGHKVLHDPNNPNTCELCGKRYRQASSLRAHMLTHTGEKPFVCDICGKGMTQKSGYKKHMLTHTGEKPHICDYCGREFRYSSNLIAHRRSHTGEKPYECPNCGKSFVSSEQLKRHKLVHTGERPHKCAICDKGFKRRSSLAHHLHTHNNVKNVNVQIMEKDAKITRSKIIEIH